MIPIKIKNIFASDVLEALHRVQSNFSKISLKPNIQSKMCYRDAKNKGQEWFKGISVKSLMFRLLKDK